mmetsp:Transcript_35143/g.49915  ORF Transcript_35143/g.49915 Transcript_35143/m.49915 type:complete len:108 (-) Transcript_35143:166-489(-)
MITTNAHAMSQCWATFNEHSSDSNMQTHPNWNTPYTDLIHPIRSKIQYINDPDNSPALDTKDKKRIQEILGTLLYYARAVDSTMLPTIGTIATQQASPTKKTMQVIA